jgi:hypothetical protein
MRIPKSRARSAGRAFALLAVIAVAGLAALALVLALTGRGPSPTSAAAAAVSPQPAAPAASDTGSGASADASGSAPSTASASPSASVAAPAPASPTAPADPVRALTAAVSSLVSADGGHVSVAVEDLSTGKTVSDNVGDAYVTASIFKLDILETLLYQDQKEGGSPGSAQRELITAMIEQSDNDAASALYDDAGGSRAITAANKVFGLTDTTVDNMAFGDTTTTVTDQIRLLREAMTSDSVLDSDNRSYIQNLMSHVESDQRWGVSAAADDSGSGASDYLLKNGWLPRSATGLWEINSIGEVSHDGHDYLVAVLSRDNESMDAGIDVIEKVAKAAVASQG